MTLEPFEAKTHEMSSHMGYEEHQMKPVVQMSFWEKFKWE